MNSRGVRREMKNQYFRKAREAVEDKELADSAKMIRLESIISCIKIESLFYPAYEKDKIRMLLGNARNFMRVENGMRLDLTVKFIGGAEYILEGV